MIKNNVESIIFKTRSDAEDVLSKLDDLIIDYGEASVADYYGLCGLTHDCRAYKYGWLSLKDATVWRRREGYTIYLPEVVELQNSKPVRNPEMDTDGDKKMELKCKNEDTYMGPYTIATKEALQKAYIDTIGKQIYFFGTMKTVNSVKIDKEYITLELV